MKANDLRKGNIVYNGYEGGNEILSAFQISQIEVMNNGGNVADYYRSLEYIPLTEEWLFKFGFEKIDHFTVNNAIIKNIKANKQLSFSDIGTPNEMVFLCDINNKDSKKVDDLVCIHNYDYDGYMHVHQLQNLYFALTQKELTIKE